MTKISKKLSDYEDKHPENTIKEVTDSISGQGKPIPKVKDKLLEALQETHNSTTIKQGTNRYEIRNWIQLLKALHNKRKYVIYIEKYKNTSEENKNIKKKHKGTVTMFTTPNENIVVKHTRTYIVDTESHTNRKKQVNHSFDTETTNAQKETMKTQLTHANWKIRKTIPQ